MRRVSVRCQICIRISVGKSLNGVKCSEVRVETEAMGRDIMRIRLGHLHLGDEGWL